MTIFRNPQITQICADSLSKICVNLRNPRMKDSLFPALHSTMPQQIRPTVNRQTACQ